MRQSTRGPLEPGSLVALGYFSEASFGGVGTTKARLQGQRGEPKQRKWR